MITPIFAVMKEGNTLRHGVVHCAYSKSKNAIFGPGFVLENAKSLACHVDSEREMYFFSNREDAVNFLMNTRMNGDEWNWEALACPKRNPLPLEAWA